MSFKGIADQMYEEEMSKREASANEKEYLNTHDN